MNRIEQFENDSAALHALSLGISEAGQAIITRHQAALFAYAYRLCSGDRALAEDLVQDTFLKLWTAVPKLTKEKDIHLRPWLYRVLRNQLIDVLRKSNRTRSDDEIPEVEDNSDSVDEKLEKQGRAQAVQSWLNELPERQRTALVLSHFERMSNPEIASILEVSVEAVESLLARGRRTLAARAKTETEKAS